uniref:Integrase catalytic domain-containing protein n=1 Tax=Eptatretus burgeri TaxID=7764 RepID=A0A8C4WWX2_EPTBU
MTSATIIKCLCQLFAIFGMPSYIHSDRGSSFMSEELKQFLHGRGIATSRTTGFNPQGNGLVERYNSIIWKAVILALKLRELKIAQWEAVLADALHSVRSLLSTSTNATPHERLFSYQCRSTSGHSIPTWLASPGTVLMKRQVRQSKYDPLVDEVELIDANPEYAHVTLSDGWETTVSLRRLAPPGDVPPGNVMGDALPLEQQQAGFENGEISH